MNKLARNTVVLAMMTIALGLSISQGAINIGKNSEQALLADTEMLIESLHKCEQGDSLTVAEIASNNCLGLTRSIEDLFGNRILHEMSDIDVSMFRLELKPYGWILYIDLQDKDCELFAGKLKLYSGLDAICVSDKVNIFV